MKDDNINVIDINKLKTHEATIPSRVNELVELIQKEGSLKKPIIADKKSLVVLDGHHRLAALKKLGCQKIAVYFVDYQSSDVRVYLRRKELMTKLIKEAVIKIASENKVFPNKTTRHLLKYRPENINYQINQLK